MSAAKSAARGGARRAALRKVAGAAKKRAANPTAYTGRNIKAGFEHLLSPQSMIANAGMMGAFYGIDKLAGGGGGPQSEDDLFKMLTDLEDSPEPRTPSQIYGIK